MTQRIDPREIDATGKADDLVLKTSGGSLVIGSSPGGGSLTVQDENGNVATGVTQLDFQGAGVTATAGTGEVVVTVSGSVGGSGSGPFVGAKALKSATQSIVANTLIPITWSSVQFDSDGFWSSGTPTRFTIPAGKAGKYLVMGRWQKDTGSGDVVAGFMKNGASIESTWERMTSASGSLGFGSFTILDLAVSDYVELFAYSAATTIGVRSEFEIARLGSTATVGTTTTAARPPASGSGAGATLFDTTLGKPIWSNGTAWVDATGAAV